MPKQHIKQTIMHAIVTQKVTKFVPDVYSAPVSSEKNAASSLKLDATYDLRL